MTEFTGRERRNSIFDCVHMDVLYSLRSLLKDPAYITAAVATLALGIGASTALFGVINATLLRPLRFGDPDRIVRLIPAHPEYGESDLTFALSDLAYLREETRTLAETAAYDTWLTTLDAPDGAERIEGAVVSGNFFRVLDVRPTLGRFFLPSDEAPDSEPVVVLSHATWRTSFGADSALIGRTVRLNGREHIVIGVAPADLDDPQLARGQDRTPQLWRPPLRSWVEGERTQRGYRSVTALARLRPEVPLEQAQAEIATIFRRLAAAYPETNARWSARIEPLQSHIMAPARAELLILFAASLLVILIACANVANLMLARTLRRTRELALQRALGSSARRVGGRMLIEALLISVAGAAAGLFIAWATTGAIVRLGGGQVPRLAATSLDVRTFLFSGLLAVTATLLFGTAPALRASRLELQSTLKDGDPHAAGGRMQRRLRSVLVTSQAAVAVTLLVGAALLLRSLWSLHAVNPGLDADGVLTARIELSWNAYDSDPAVWQAFDRMREAVHGVPGVELAGFVSVLPFSGGYWQTGFTIVGGPPPAAERGAPSAELRTASPGFFHAARVALVDGRLFNARDVPGAPPVVLVNRRLAEEYWPDRSPIGQQIEVNGAPHDIIGVVGDVHQFALDKPAEPVLYLAQAQAPSWLTRYSYLVVRAANGDALSIAGGVHNSIRSIDRGIPISDVRSMDAVLGTTTAAYRFRAALLAMLGGLAFALAALGIYSIVSYSLAQRSREIAVRLTLGAQSQQVFGLLTRQEMRPVVLGVVLGVAGALAAGRLLGGLLFGVTAHDPAALLLAPALLLLVAFVGTLLPALRAVRADPGSTLRAD